METLVPRKGPVVYRVWAGRRIIWQRSVSVLSGRRDNYPERRRAVQEQEQVCRTVRATGEVPREFANETPRPQRPSKSYAPPGRDFTLSAGRHRGDFSACVRGRSAVWNRPLYAYRVFCSCGVVLQINDNKRAALERWRAHVRAARAG